MNRKFYLIDRENGNEKRRITMKFIVDHFNGDGAGPVRWNRNNVDLERFRADMDELGYDFVIERGQKKPQSKADQLRKLRRVEAKLALLKARRPNGDQSDRACRKLVDKICAVQERADQLMSEIRHKRVRPKREDAEKPPQMTEADSDMLFCAFRYCLGRMTCVVEKFCWYATNRVTQIDTKYLRLMEREITSEQVFDDEHTEKSFAHLGMDCDRAEWLRFRETVRNELRRREEDHA